MSGLVRGRILAGGPAKAAILDTSPEQRPEFVRAANRGKETESFWIAVLPDSEKLPVNSW